MFLLKVLLLGFSVIVSSNCDSPILPDAEFLDFQTPRSLERVGSVEYRLPESVIPLHYDIDLDVYFDGNTVKEDYTFDGRTMIHVQVLEDNVSQITLHENLYQIVSLTVTDENGIVISLNTETPITREPLYHFLRINFASTLNIQGIYIITITYVGRMNETPLSRGMFKGYYYDFNGNERIYAATHFQPYNARQVFPCFDEPLFKATKTLHLTVPQAYVNGTYSNTRLESSQTLSNGKVRLNFYETPKMSSYLLTMIISEEFQSIAEDNTLSTPIRILARPNAQGQGEHSLALAVNLTNFFDEYFGILYTNMSGYLNNDHVAVPDWASGGTENWGLVSYRELYLLVDEAETPVNTEQYIATILSHELVHKWFGNLVTCHWWSVTWLNEGFASYFGYFGSQSVFGKYDLHEHFNARYVAASLSTDAGVATVPLNNPNVNTPTEVTGHFGTISYSKGAVFVRILYDILTPETFRKACQIFLQALEFEPAYPIDLYEAFNLALLEDNSASHLENFDLIAFFENWADQAGYPLLNVEIDSATGVMSLSQERFFISASAIPTDQTWHIPITYTTEQNVDWENLQPVYIMTETNAEILSGAVDQWIIFNKQQHGPYRVNYDESSWNKIATALHSNRETVHYLNRGAIVDDIFAFMRSERMTYARGFYLLDWLANETNYHVWDPAIVGFSWLLNRLRHLPEELKKLEDYVLLLMETAIEELGYDVRDGETTTVSLARQIVMTLACDLGHEECVSTSLEKFANMKINNIWVHPYLRRFVFTTAIRHGDASDWEFLYDRLLSSNVANDDIIMTRALACTSDATLLNRYMELTLSRVIKPHDKINAFNYALLGNRENPRIVLDYVRNNVDIIREQYVNQFATVLTNLAAYLPEEEDLAEMESWLLTNQGIIPEATTGLNAIASARSSLAWGTQKSDEIVNAITTSSSSRTLMQTSLLILPVFIIYFTRTN